MGSAKKISGIASLTISIIVALAGLTMPSFAHASSIATPAAFEPIGEYATAPKGWVDFCKRYAGECDTRSVNPRSLKFTRRLRKMLASVNTAINKAIVPETDMAHWGVEDRWDYPTDGYGDCEDYALLKRRILIGRGLPPEDLLMTVVWTRGDEGHAVLTVHTVKGDYVLDNQQANVMLWSRSGYSFVERQSRLNPNEWIYVDGVPPKTPTAVASTNE